jgi:DNA-binding Lrp family transcriptional regulator
MEAAPMRDRLDRRLVALTREGLPLDRDPYGAVARALGVPRSEVLERLARMMAEKQVRRVSAVVDQRRAGFAGNVMAAWPVGDDRADEVGAEVSRRPEVTHCYLRLERPGWPYRLFAMIHGKDEAACRRLIADLTEQLDLSEPAILPTVRELKRSPLPAPPDSDP